jgi:UrcA family protein
MNTKSLPLIVLGSITIAIHLVGFAAVHVGAQKLLAQSVSYRDLDLARPADAAVLYDRIGHAAVEVCETFDGAKGSGETARRQCLDQAIAATVARVNDANLTARHHAGYKVRLAAQSQKSAT